MSLCSTGVGRGRMGQGVASGGLSMGGVGSACAAAGDGLGDCVGVSRGWERGVGR